MTVVRNYDPTVGRSDSTIRKGLRVRVVKVSPDGKTLRVATKTGTQFEIPVTHLCMSRKNSEPSPYGHDAENHEIALISSGILTTSTQNTAFNHSPMETFPASPTTKLPKSPSNRLPLECGKIMTVIRNFVPSPDDPMVTIRRGLRVKVLGGQDDLVKVVTKTGTTFSIPRSYLRLAHKTSDASAFTAVDAGAKSPPHSPPYRGDTVNSPEWTNGQGIEGIPHGSPVRDSSTKHVCATPPQSASQPPGSNAAPAGTPEGSQPTGVTLEGSRLKVFELC
jgi:hypothetical protein